MAAAGSGTEVAYGCGTEMAYVWPQMNEKELMAISEPHELFQVLISVLTKRRVVLEE